MLPSGLFVSLPFFDLFRKSHLLPTSAAKFNLDYQFTKSSFQFCSWGALLNVKWSKTIQFRDSRFHSLFHTLLVHLFVQLHLFVEPYPLLDQPLCASMPLPTTILVYQGYMFSPTELSCPSLGTAWTSWGMFPLTLRVILFVEVELPLPFRLGSLSK